MDTKRLNIKREREEYSNSPSSSPRENQQRHYHGIIFKHGFKSAKEAKMHLKRKEEMRKEEKIKEEKRKEEKHKESVIPLNPTTYVFISINKMIKQDIILTLNSQKSKESVNIVNIENFISNEMLLSIVELYNFNFEFLSSLYAEKEPNDFELKSKIGVCKEFLDKITIIVSNNGTLPFTHSEGPGNSREYLIYKVTAPNKNGLKLLYKTEINYWDEIDLEKAARGIPQEERIFISYSVFNTNMEKLERMYKNLNNYKSQMDNFIKEKKKALGIGDPKNISLREDHQSELDNLELELQKIQNEISFKEEEYKTYKKDVDSLSNEIFSLTKELKDLDIIRQEKERYIIDKQNETNKLLEERIKVHEQIEEVNNHIKEIEEKKNNFFADKDNYNAYRVKKTLPTEDIKNFPGITHVYSGVNFEDTKEKQELENLDEEAEEYLCLICSKNIKNVVFCDCSHLAVCEECFEKMLESESKKQLDPKKSAPGKTKSKSSKKLTKNSKYDIETTVPIKCTICQKPCTNFDVIKFE